VLGVALAQGRPWIAAMSIVRSSAGLPNADKEAAAEKSRRLAIEADMIADAQASVAAGRIVSLEG
jgi:hypothetical protein